MKQLLSSLIALFLMGSAVFGQNNSQPKAWEITFKTHVAPLPNASKEELEKIKKMNENLHSTKSLA